MKKILEAQIAQSFADGADVELYDYTEITDEAAAILGKHHTAHPDDWPLPQLCLWKIEDLSSQSAKNLVQFNGRIELTGLRAISLEVARTFSLQEEPGVLELGVAELSVDVAKALSEHRGSMMVMNRIESLSLDAAKALAAYEGHLVINSVVNIDELVAKELSRTKGTVSLYSARSSSSEVALEILRGCEYIYLSADEEYPDEDWD